MKRFIKIALVALILAGCGTPLEQPWKNFNAYFNTYYNTKQHYEDGLEQNQRQIPEVNPEEPIQVFLPPANSGLEDFELAIETGATILREHPESKYVEPSIFIIGKSYFYRRENFAALEKFQEMQSFSDGTAAQEAVFWQSRVYNQMRSSREGIAFLEQEMDVIENWDQAILAKAKVMLAQLYIQENDWETASELLRDHISNLDDKEIRARAYFLQGQVLKYIKDFEGARLAFSSVPESIRNYDLVFNANRKEAAVLRELGDYDLAYDLYRSMERNDKNIDARTELQYEMARTIQLRGEPERALEMYEDILRNEIITPTPLTRAKIYNGQAEAYRFSLNNFQLAAAYYDSASQERVAENRLPEGFNAAELANSFGEYARVRQEISRLDSLLYLGRLEPAAFDSVIAEIRNQRQQELEEELLEMQRHQDQLINIEQEPETASVSAESSEYGFLNIKNQVRLADASLQFQAIWGNRPLADNWRRGADVIGSGISSVDETESTEEGQEVRENNVIQRPSGIQVALDLSEIPTTPAAQDSMVKRLENRYYLLANVFFLSLDMPDSASVYYERIATNDLSPEFIPGSLYSLSEIELLEGDEDQAIEWGRRLVDEYPNTEFALRLSRRLNLKLNRNSGADERFVEDMYADLQDTSSADPAAKAKQLQRLAESGSLPGQKPILLYEAAREYIKAARITDSDSTDKIQEWFAQQESWSQQQKNFTELKDSAATVLSDTTLAESDRTYWQQIADSTLAGPGFYSTFPFEGMYWDSTRSVLATIENRYASSSVMPKVRVLQQTLEPPTIEPPDEAIQDSLASDLPVASDSSSADISPCSEKYPNLSVRGGIEQFLETIEYPDWAEESGMSGELIYTLSISPQGEVTDYVQKSRMDRSGIPQMFEQSIETQLRFEPTGEEETIQCDYSFSYSAR